MKENTKTNVKDQMILSGTASLFIEPAFLATSEGHITMPSSVLAGVPDVKIHSPDIFNTIRDRVLIPRPSVFTANLDIFRDLEMFSKVTGYKPDDNGMLVKNRFHSILSKVRALDSVFRNVRRAFTGSSKNGYSLIEEKPVNELFDADHLTQWRRKKALLVAEMEKHEAAQSRLSEARVQCWRSEAKMKKYQLIVDTQTSALKHNPSELKQRTAALKKMQCVLARKQHLHDVAVSAFHSCFLHEISARESVQQLSMSLEKAVVSDMSDAIARLMLENRQTISASQVERYARNIYARTSRSYEFDIVMCDPCQKAWVGKPVHHRSKMDAKAMKKL